MVVRALEGREDWAFINFVYTSCRQPPLPGFRGALQIILQLHDFDLIRISSICFQFSPLNATKWRFFCCCCTEASAGGSALLFRGGLVGE